MPFSSARPIVRSLSAHKLENTGPVTVVVAGEDFHPNCGVRLDKIGGAGTTMPAVSNIVVNSPTEIQFDVTPTMGHEMTVDVVVFYGPDKESIDWPNNGNDEIEFVDDLWLDLRTGGAVLTFGNAAGNDIRYRSTMSHIRAATGVQFSGAGPWSSWVKFESLPFTRGNNTTVRWVYQNPDNAWMIGIGSDATDESSTSQYGQGESFMYQNNATNVYGAYGNNGTVGSATGCSDSATITASAYFRWEQTDDGAPGGIGYLWELPSSNRNDWDDTSNQIWSITNWCTIAPDESNLMPMVIPRDGAGWFLGVRLG